MRGLILCCFAALATAAPQGYSYAAQPGHQFYASAPQSANAASSSSVSSSSFLKDLHTVRAAQSANVVESHFGAPELFAYAHNKNNNNNDDIVAFSSGQGGLFRSSQARYLAPSGITFDAAAFQQAQQQPQQQQQQQHQQLLDDAAADTLISKRFYIHAAPEDVEESEDVKQHFVSLGKPRKNYNVVFIQTPVKAPQKTSLKIVPAINEEKTVIYVLDKKHDPTEIDAHIHEPITSTAKPEVYFIKYKTSEEAAHAQQTIQAQYESLGGSTHVSHEGTAASSSVIGSLDDVKQVIEAQTHSHVQEHEAQQLAAALGAQQQHEGTVVSQAPSGQLSLSQDGSSNGNYLPPAKFIY